MQCLSAQLPLETMRVRRGQFPNALLPMDVTLSGILISSSPVQLENAATSMNVTLSGIVTLFSPMHSANAANPIVVTLSGMLNVVRLQPQNSLSPMNVSHAVGNADLCQAAAV